MLDLGRPLDTLAFSGCLIFIFHPRGHGVTGMAKRGAIRLNPEQTDRPQGKGLT